MCARISDLAAEIELLREAMGVTAYEPGPIDGLYGRRTKGAIEAFERDMGMSPTGEATIDLWRKVRREVKPEAGPVHREEATEAAKQTGQTSPGDVGGTQGGSNPTNLARRPERTTQGSVD